MKKITYRTYTNKQLAYDYYKIKSWDMDCLDTPDRNRQHFEGVKGLIRKAYVNIPKFYWNHNGRLTKLVVHGISPNTVGILEEILEKKLGKPSKKEKVINNREASLLSDIAKLRKSYLK